MTDKERAAKAAELLEEKYPQAACSLIYNKERPYELLISTRLSAQCTDARVNIVTAELFSKYQSLAEIADAKHEDVENIIRSCGLYKVKARDIIEMSKQLIERHDGELPDTIEELTALSGIGRKTANLILGDVFHKPAVVVDTHCIRICSRIGLVSGKDPYKIELKLKELLPPEKSSDFCHRLVLFGREVCSARSPKCEKCSLRSICEAKGGI